MSLGLKQKFKSFIKDLLSFTQSSVLGKIRALQQKVFWPCKIPSHSYRSLVRSATSHATLSQHGIRLFSD